MEIPPPVVLTNKNGAERRQFIDPTPSALFLLHRRTLSKPTYVKCLNGAPTTPD